MSMEMLPNKSSAILNDKPNIDGVVEFVSSSGHRFYGRPDTEDFGVFEYVVDNNEYNLPAHFNPDDIVIDIGAHIGSFSYAVLSRGAKKVYAFEAHPQNYSIACKNLLPFADKVVCRNLAVWRSDQPTQTLFNEDITGYKKTGGISVLWNQEGLPVQSIALDDILFEASNGFTKPIKLVKLDCEGAEYPILFTSRQLKMIEEISGEYHEMEPAQIPGRAKMEGEGFQRFDRNSLKEFFEREGWSVLLEPKSKADGLFHARQMPRATDTRVPLETEFDVERLKDRIRESVARRRKSGSSFAEASAELYALLSTGGVGALPVPEPSTFSTAEGNQVAQSKLTLQSDFRLRDTDHYDVGELLIYHDRAFIWNAYRALLKREPDEDGLQSYLQRLRSGSANKVDILASLRYSPEGKRRKVRVDGLIGPAIIRRLYRVPAIGYLAELTVSLLRLPRLIRNQRQFENYVVAQQERIADHLNNTKHKLTERVNEIDRNAMQVDREIANSFSQRLVELAEEQKNIAKLQHQQLASIFRKQPRVSTNGSTQINAGDRLLPDVGHDLDPLLASLADSLRGSEEDVKTGFRIYLPILREAGVVADILDLGCGRGEWLGLLKEEGLHAYGVETNRLLSKQARNQGLTVVKADALSHLETVPSESLQAVTGFHLIEHLQFERLVQLLFQIKRALKPGGLVIFETPNPKNLVVAACNFYADPTHSRPQFPETLQSVFEYVGFTNISIQFLHPVNDSQNDNEVLQSPALNTWLFGPRDFAIVACKDPNSRAEQP